MANAIELLELDVASLSEKVRKREVSPVEVTEAYLARIDQIDERVNAYITVTADLARTQAKQAEAEIAAGRWRGPFHGVPVGLKDLCYTKGILTTGGSKILAEFVPDYDSTVWARLEAQGAILLGKLNLHEFAWGGTSSNPHFGPVHNPYNLERIPGGSSGGSGAAIVSRMAAATIGTDTAGSIRIPAAFCGCVGLKPTWSRVSRYGVIPLADSMDHVGPITRTVRDAAMMLQVIAGHDPNDSTSSREPVPDFTGGLGRDLKGARIGIIKEFVNGLPSEASQALQSAVKTLESAGAAVDEISAPSLLAAPALSMVAGVEALEFHDQWMRTRPQDYGQDVRERHFAATLVKASTYVRAQRSRALMLAEAMAALANHDVLIAPGNIASAPRIGLPGRAMDLYDIIVRFTIPFDATGQPALMIPIGLAQDGLPLAMQIIGKPFDEATVVRIGDAYERARGPLPPPQL